MSVEGQVYERITSVQIIVYTTQHRTVRIISNFQTKSQLRRCLLEMRGPMGISTVKNHHWKALLQWLTAFNTLQSFTEVHCMSAAILHF